MALSACDLSHQFYSIMTNDQEMTGNLDSKIIGMIPIYMSNVEMAGKCCTFTYLFLCTTLGH
jgi:hypothetical protein